MDNLSNGAKIFSLEDWLLEGDISDDDRLCEVTVMLKYPDEYQFKDFTPRERVKQIDYNFKKSLKKLIATGFFEKYEIQGTKKRPGRVKALLKFGLLNRLDDLDYVESIFIESIYGAKKVTIQEEIVDKYYCVKMTVVLAIEGVASKKQSIETRFVLVKAKTCEDAYEKLDKRKGEYETTYLNHYGRFVKWSIDSFDDCYETDITCPEDVDKEEGVEIYSKLGSRKTKSPFVWDGK